MRRQVMLVATSILALACSRTAQTTTTSATTTTAAATTTTDSTTTTSSLRQAPWASPALSQEAVPGVLVEQWEVAENNESCAALAPEGGVEGAIPRAASFAGGWAVAWDAAEGPGMEADGTFCADCGRSVVGVAGTGVLAQDSPITQFPTIIEWSDGSLLGLGPEGQIEGDLPVTDPLTEGGASQTLIGFLAVAGQECLYNIWDRRGSEPTLVDLIDRLRFVEGLGSP